MRGCLGIPSGDDDGDDEVDGDDDGDVGGRQFCINLVHWPEAPH